LALRSKDGQPSRPEAGDTAHQGMQLRLNTRRRTRVPPSKIGSISQATKISQAIRDSRG
jgi:hypothetical protein